MEKNKTFFIVLCMLIGLHVLYSNSITVEKANFKKQNFIQMIDKEFHNNIISIKDQSQVIAQLTIILGDVSINDMIKSLKEKGAIKKNNKNYIFCLKKQFIGVQYIDSDLYVTYFYPSSDCK